MNKHRRIWGLGVSLLAAACETPRPTNDVQPVDAVADTGVDSMAQGDGGDVVTPEDVAMEAGPDVIDASSAPDAGDAADVVTPICSPAATDFQPRTAMASWAAPWSGCMAVSDPNRYPYFSMSAAAPVRVARLGALEAPGGFFDPTRDPAPSEFVAASVDAGANTSAEFLFRDTGVATRFQRRADEHYAVPAGLALNSTYQDFCGTAANAMANMDYCAGPVSLNAVLNDSLAAGMAGMGSSRVHAARIQGVYEWWLYLSAYKESLTCAPVRADCDSAAGYYAGTAGRNDAVQFGLARSLLALGDSGRVAHDRIWDAMLAVRCWRDLDGGRMSDGGTTMPATDEMLRERARNQQDAALTRGIVLIVQSRLRAFASTDGDPVRAAERRAHAAWIGVVGPLLANGIERWSRGSWASRRASVAAGVVTRAIAELRAGESITTTQAGRASADLEALFPCP